MQKKIFSILIITTLILTLGIGFAFSADEMMQPTSLKGKIVAIDADSIIIEDENGKMEMSTKGYEADLKSFKAGDNVLIKSSEGKISSIEKIK